jgi:hypothetical protein
MLKISVAFLFLFAVGANAMVVVAMPEPSALPELMLGLAGVTYFAWRQRKRSR